MAGKEKLLKWFVVIVSIGSILSLAAVSQADDLTLSASKIAEEWPFDIQITIGPVPPPGLDRGLLYEPLDYEVVISGVPAYIWLNGCGPTAAGMVLGYWDGQGFDNLVPGSAATQTQAVDDMISSSGNYDDYCLPMDSFPIVLPDRSEPPFGDEHPDDCIADFIKTSQSYYSCTYGFTMPFHMDDGLVDYAQSVDPQYEVSSEFLIWGEFTWDTLRSEIDAARPVILLVDTDGTLVPDHYVTAIGYGEQGTTRMYACLDTWDHAIHWYEFKRYTSGQPWGIYGGITCSIDFAGPLQINLQSPANWSVLSSPPTFAWTNNGGTNNRYAVDLSTDWAFSWYWSTYENAQQPISFNNNWTMPTDIWNTLPFENYVYWRVRGADLDARPLTVINSNEVWWFYKQ
jgi:hypothetical protein